MLEVEVHLSATGWAETATKSSMAPLQNHSLGIGATTLWDPWDASPPTLGNLGTKCIWSPPTFVTVIFFSLGSTHNFRGLKVVISSACLQYECHLNGLWTGGRPGLYQRPYTTSVAERNAATAVTDGCSDTAVSRQCRSPAAAAVAGLPACLSTVPLTLGGHVLGRLATRTAFVIRVSFSSSFHLRCS